MFVSIRNMDYQLSSPILFASFMLFVVMILKIFRKSGNYHSTSNLPPGPWKLPLIGNMIQLVGSQLPHHRLRDLASKYGPLMHLKLGEVSHIVASSPEIAKEILKNHDISFADRPRVLVMRTMVYNYTDIAFAPYGEYWRQVRKICTLELLTAKRVQSYRSIREEEVSNLIRSISSNAGSPINLSEMVSSLVNNIVSRAAVGRRCKERESFTQIAEKIAALAVGFRLADLHPSIKLLEVVSGMRSEIEKVHREADKIVESIINEHRAFKSMQKTSEGEADDLLHVLLDLQEHGNLEFSLTTDNIKALIVDMFVAGIETSSTTVGWAMSEMLKNTRVLEKAQEEVRQVFDGKRNVDETRLGELQYFRLVIKETLRLHPPLPFLLPRECRESCKILGYDIPVGSKVLVNAWAIGRDPRYWNDAESFYPERFLETSVDYKGVDYEFIPFGAGRRICPGLSFGLANVELPLARLLYHFNWKLPGGIKNEDLDMTEQFSVVVGRKNYLCLIPVQYHHRSRE